MKKRPGVFKMCSKLISYVYWKEPTTLTTSSHVDVREALLDLRERVYVCALERERGKSQSNLIRYWFFRSHVTDGISDVTGKPWQGTICKMKRKKSSSEYDPDDCTVLGAWSFVFESHAEYKYCVLWIHYTKYIKWMYKRKVISIWLRALPKLEFRVNIFEKKNFLLRSHSQTNSSFDRMQFALYSTCVLYWPARQSGSCLKRVRDNGSVGVVQREWGIKEVWELSKESEGLRKCGSCLKRVRDNERAEWAFWV
jgi:hypothetical protein